MIEWWNGLDFLLKLLYCVAIPATLLLVIQTAMSVIGGVDAGPGLDMPDTSGLDGGMDFNGSPDIGELADGSDLSHLGHSGNADISHPVTDGGNPHDFSLLRMFTLQGIMAFLTVFGWSSIVSLNAGTQPFLALAVGLAFGFLAMYAIAKLVHLSSKLTENGTLNLKNALGETGTVYIPIPAENHGEGKINLYIQGQYVEFSAITSSKTPLSTGSSVRVIDLRNGILVVEQDN